MATLSGNSIEKAAVKYAEAYPLRSLAQLVPVVGGAIDALIGGHGAQIQMNRLNLMIDEMRTQLSDISQPSTLSPEDLQDLLFSAFGKVTRTRQQEKIRAFGRIVSQQVASPREFDDVENALQLLDSLDATDISVLRAAVDAPLCDGGFVGLRVVALTDSQAVPGQSPPRHLPSYLGEFSKTQLRRSCSKLVAAGLLHDEGVGRWDVSAHQFFVSTDLALWFFDWLKGVREV